jgi:hypothetical protein
MTKKGSHVGKSPLSRKTRFCWSTAFGGHSLRPYESPPSIISPTAMTSAVLLAPSSLMERFLSRSVDVLCAQQRWERRRSVEDLWQHKPARARRRCCRVFETSREGVADEGRTIRFVCRSLAFRCSLAFQAATRCNTTTNC